MSHEARGEERRRRETVVRSPLLETVLPQELMIDWNEPDWDSNLPITRHFASSLPSSFHVDPYMKRAKQNDTTIAAIATTLHTKPKATNTDAEVDAKTMWNEDKQSFRSRASLLLCRTRSDDPLQQQSRGGDEDRSTFHADDWLHRLQCPSTKKSTTNTATATTTTATAITSTRTSTSMNELQHRVEKLVITPLPPSEADGTTSAYSKRQAPRLERLYSPCERNHPVRHPPRPRRREHRSPEVVAKSKLKPYHSLIQELVETPATSTLGFEPTRLLPIETISIFDPFLDDDISVVTGDADIRTQDTIFTSLWKDVPVAVANQGCFFGMIHPFPTIQEETKKRLHQIPDDELELSGGCLGTEMRIRAPTPPRQVHQTCGSSSNPAVVVTPPNQQARADPVGYRIKNGLLNSKLLDYSKNSNTTFARLETSRCDGFKHETSLRPVTPARWNTVSHSGTSSQERSVTFANPMVTAMRLRPLTQPEDVPALFFVPDELDTLVNDRVNRVPEERFECVAITAGDHLNIDVQFPKCYSD